MKKIFTLSAITMVAVSASAADGISVVKANPSMQPTCISANGKWVAGDQSIWNVETGKVFTTEEAELDLKSVSNTGIAVGVDGNYAVTMDETGKLTYIDGTSARIFSTARGISADGTIIVGGRFDSDFFGDACYWLNGEYHALPLPEEYEDLPEDIGCQYTLATGVSEDGSVIVGNIVSGTGANAFIMWQRNAAGEYEYKALYQGLMEFGWEEEKPYIYMEAETVSANGKWIALTLQRNDWDDVAYYIGRYNIETGELERSAALEDAPGDYWATGISDLGVTTGFVEQEEMSMYGRKSVVWTEDSKNAELVSTFCKKNPDVVALGDNDALVITGITADSNHLCGFTVAGEGIEGFVINVPYNQVGVNTVAAENNGAKAVYDLQGRRVNGEPATGLYIVVENGKAQKVLVK